MSRRRRRAAQARGSPMARANADSRFFHPIWTSEPLGPHEPDEADCLLRRRPPGVRPEQSRAVAKFPLRARSRLAKCGWTPPASGPGAHPLENGAPNADLRQRTVAERDVQVEIRKAVGGDEAALSLVAQA